MSQMRLLCLCTIIFAGMALSSSSTMAAGPVPAVASSLGKAILKYFGKEGSQEASEYLSRRGGQELLDRVAASAARQGGDEAVRRVAKLASLHGPEAIRAMDNVPSMLPVLNVLDELPAAEVRSALVKFSAGTPGRELATAVERLGVSALRSELKHPGVGLVLVRDLGEEGVDLASRLSSEQAIAIGRHSGELATLPAAQRTRVLALLHNDTDRMVRFVGRFVEANPGKTLFTVATTTVILAEPDRILGGDEIVFDAEGNPIVVRKAGLAGRTIEAGGAAAAHVSDRYLRPVFYALMAFAGTFAVFWMAIRLWHTHRREKLKTELLKTGAAATDSRS